MTLEDLIRQNGLCGRILETYEKNGFAFRGTITRVWQEGILVHFALANFARSFATESGPWKNLPNSTLTVGKNTLIKTADDGTISFTLQPSGSRGYIYTRGKKNGGKP